ncbi:MAG TPA: hypothetical protein VG013_29025 [Gemmataceae bacterium]|jgi:hypothetical protein|nr:hypothetical protein [Gemmataceae bacterium]
MIQMPRRSVTRFFIPLIDVLTLLFCIFLLMPVVQPSDDDPEAGGAPADQADRQRKIELIKEIQRLRTEKVQALQQRMAIRVLEIDPRSGKLYYYDPTRKANRRVEITKDNFAAVIKNEQRAARGEDVYFLILYPRPATGISPYPEDQQRREYNRWFQEVAHGYDIPLAPR